MSCKFTRREVLARGLGAAGLLSTGGVSHALAAGFQTAPPLVPDRSAQAPALPVAIKRCQSYEPQLVRRRLDEAFDLIGGIGKLVNGKTVTVKLNLTGGAYKLGGLPAHRTYHVHPNMVAALCAALHHAGAKRMMIVESQYTRDEPRKVLTNAGWDVKSIESAGGHKVSFEDTRNRGAWPKYSRLEVSYGGFVFPAFDVNQSYDKTDVFISLAKMKDHANAGITLGIKNQFGMAPTSLYGDDAPNENTVSNRGAILHKGEKEVPAGVPAELDHGLTDAWSSRVPRITVDTLGARPVDLTLIDGVETNRGGEGPWIKGVQPIQPKLLVVGRNVVCTDAVTTAVMGYDPAAEHNEFPFPAENHLKLAASTGIGSIDLDRIEVRGLSVDEALFPFNPRRLKVGAPIF